MILLLFWLLAAFIGGWLNSRYAKKMLSMQYILGLVLLVLAVGAIVRSDGLTPVAFGAHFLGIITSVVYYKTRYHLWIWNS